jgi:tetratricopeptide (TPR) repeat protein
MPMNLLSLLSFCRRLLGGGLLLCTALLVLPTQLQAQPASPAYEQGVRAYRAGDVRAALAHFQAAEQQGNASPALHYNLGLCHYRLKQDGEARRYFRLARQAPAYTGLADYHLALIEHRAGNTAQALRLLDAAERQQPSLRDRIRQARTRMSDAPVVPSTSFYLSVAGGLDSNANLANDRSTDGTAADQSLFLESLGLIRHERSALDLQARLYVRDVLEDRRYDQLAADLEALTRFRLGGWRAAAGPALATIRYGGETFADQYGLRLNLQRGGGATRVKRIQYEGDQVEAGALYREFTGQRHRLRFLAAGERLGGGYALEWNDRRDLVRGDEFFSQSPIRHSLLASWALGRSGSTRLNAAGLLRFSHFQDPDRFLQDGQLTERTRRETLLGGSLTALFAPRSGLRPFAEINLSLNQANLDYLDYERAELLFGVEWF